MALMEAMSWRLPVIASAIRGNNELVVPGKGGYLAGKQNIREYAAGMAEMLCNPEAGRQMGRWNETAVAAYSEERVMKRMEKCYQWLQMNQ